MKRLCIIFFLNILTLSIAAQPFAGGFKAGLAATQVAGDTYGGYNKAGINAGFFVNLEMSDKWYINMELAFIQKGSRFNPNPDLPERNAYLLRLSYAELPFMVQFRKGPFAAGAGISVDFLLHHYEEVNYLQVSTDDWRRVGLNSILGAQYRLGSQWTLDFRTVNSITSIRKNAVPGSVRRYGHGFGQYNDGLILSLHYTILPSAKR
jgi:opacity protein-like surface antigen